MVSETPQFNAEKQQQASKNAEAQTEYVPKKDVSRELHELADSIAEGSEAEKNIGTSIQKEQTTVAQAEVTAPVTTMAQKLESWDQDQWTDGTDMTISQKIAMKTLGKLSAKHWAKQEAVT